MYALQSNRSLNVLLNNKAIILDIETNIYEIVMKENEIHIILIGISHY